MKAEEKLVNFNYIFESISFLKKVYRINLQIYHAL